MNELDYQHFVDLFKTSFYSSLSKNIIPLYSELLKKVVSAFGIDELNPLQQNNIESWYEQIASLSYLKDALVQEDLYEVLLYGPTDCARETSQGMQDVCIGPLTSHDYQVSLEVLAMKNAQEWNYSSPFKSFLCPINGSLFRATLVHFSLTPHGVSKLFLRKITHKIIPLNAFCDDLSWCHFLQESSLAKKNILIAGATASGKTTLLKSLLHLLSPKEHIVVLEDTYELGTHRPNQTHLLSCPKASTGKTLKDYCAYAMRMRPDRLIVGELRSTEVAPFLLSLNTGHRGAMSTIHANSAPDALERLSTLFGLYHSEMDSENIKALIAGGVDLVIFLQNKKLVQIIEVSHAIKGRFFWKEIFSREENECEELALV